jgi:hypothetical protein
MLSAWLKTVDSKLRTAGQVRPPAQENTRPAAAGHQTEVSSPSLTRTALSAALPAVGSWGQALQTVGRLPAEASASQRQEALGTLQQAETSMRQQLARPEVRDLLLRGAVAATGGAPLGPEDDKKLTLLLSGLANALGSVVGDSVQGFVTGQPVAHADMQRGALIAFAVGMISPGGAGVLRRMQENAAACVAEGAARQMLGLDPQDPRQLAVNALFCAGAGAVADGIFRALGRVKTPRMAVEGIGQQPLRSMTDGGRAAPAGVSRPDLRETRAASSSGGPSTRPPSEPNGRTRASPPVQWSSLGPTAVIVSTDSPQPKTLGPLLVAQLNGNVPTVVVGERYLPSLIGDMPANGRNRTVYAPTLGSYENVQTVFYARPTDIADATSLKGFLQLALEAKPGSTVVVATGQGQSLASIGNALRPDVKWMGVSDNAFIRNAASPSEQQQAVSAVRDAIRSGNDPKANVARPLKQADAVWMSKEFGLEVPPGLAVAAPFDSSGNLDRSNFASRFTQDPAGSKQSLKILIAERDHGIRQLMTLAQGRDLSLTPSDFSARLSDPGALRNSLGFQPPDVLPTRALPQPSPGLDYSPLGSVAVIGGTGNIGAGITTQLAEKVPVVSVSRRSNLDSLPKGVDWAQTLEGKSDVRTVILTASVDWKRDPEGKIIFDRSYLLAGNLNILMDQLPHLPRGATVMSVTNPSNTIAWAVKALRPDLRVYGHEGTDLARLRARAPSAEGHEGILFGPHSPNLVAVDGQSNLKPVVPVTGQVYSDMSGQSATLPTANGAVDELLAIANGQTGSYAAPINREDAAWLTNMMRQHVAGWTKEIPEGIVLAAPMNPKTSSVDRAAITQMFERFARDEQRGIEYQVLRPIPNSTKFRRESVKPTQLFASALDELLGEREQAIAWMSNRVRERNPQNVNSIEDLLNTPDDLLRLLQTSPQSQR